MLGSGIPTYAVLGNHDHAAGGAAEMTRALEDAGIPVLQNRAVTLPVPDGAEPLYLVGIGPLRPGLDDVDAALADVPDGAARLVLMHNPLTFPELPAGSAPLAVAGHTHCGQVALPFSEHWSWLDVTAREKIVADGWAEADGQRDESADGQHGAEQVQPLAGVLEGADAETGQPGEQPGHHVDQPFALWSPGVRAARWIAHPGPSTGPTCPRTGPGTTRGGRPWLGHHHTIA